MNTQQIVPPFRKNCNAFGGVQVFCNIRINYPFKQTFDHSIIINITNE